MEKLTKIFSKNNKHSKKPKISKQELESRRELMTSILQDVGLHRISIYRMSFMRGIFFGFGSVLGGTIFVTLFVWLMTILAQHVPFFGDFFELIGNAIQNR